MANSFYESLGDDRYESTERTIGPWGPDSQHAGPPSALLGRAVEHVDDRIDMRVARITFDILRPVPIAELTVRAAIERDGRSVQLVHATLSAGEVEVMRASAWRIRTGELDLDGTAEEAPGGPDEGAAVELLERWEGTNYLNSMDISFIKGSFLEPGPAIAWMRPRVPLVDDEPIAPLTRVLAAADSASGISSALDFRKWVFINPDLSIYLHRYPAGEWVCMDAATVVEPHGIGMARSRLFDRSGAIGASLQSLFIKTR